MAETAKKLAVRRLRKRGLRNEKKAHRQNPYHGAAETSGPVAKHRGARGAL